MDNLYMDNQKHERCEFLRDIKILPSMCDGDSRLSIAAALDAFQNTATLHADTFDIGPDGMNRRNYFWIITKTRIHINRMPEMMDDVVLRTWIQAPERISCERDYSISMNDEVLAYGRSIWAVISRDTGKLVPMKGLYPELDFCVAPPDDKAFLRLGKKFEGAEEIGSYTIRSIDIDLGGHMNNVNYVRAMLGCFTTEEIRRFDISQLELNFISQSYEGETLTFLKKTSEDGGAQDGCLFDIAAAGPDGKIVFVARVY